jgi:hypothetical protein
MKVEGTSSLGVVDHNAIRSNQASIIGALLIAFVIDSVLVVGLVAGLMLLGAALGTTGFRWLYVGVLQPLGILRPDPIADNAAPHRFAQALGGGVLVAATLALALEAPILGWVLTWLVIGLAAVNLILGFCAGCFAYYWLARWRIPGFAESPPGDIFPGLRPPRV